MICTLCNEDKDIAMFPHHKNEKKPRTTCYKCINGIARIKYKKEGRVRARTSPKRVKKEKVDRFNPIARFSVKLHRVERCAYVLCRCVIEEGQERFFNTNIKPRINYCSKWCREIAEVDKKLGLNNYEIQEGNIYSSA